MWSMFADHPDRRRDFLWREEAARSGRLDRVFYILSPRLPVDRLGIFEMQSKPFELALAPGDRLRFRLRANPVVSEPKPGQRLGKRIDPVARALAKLPTKERAAQRHAVTVETGRQWLAGQGVRAGFA